MDRCSQIATPYVIFIYLMHNNQVDLLELPGVDGSTRQDQPTLPLGELGDPWQV